MSNIEIIANYIKDTKLKYSVNELIKEKWATIGGRIEDYAHIVKTQGIEETYKAIRSKYGNISDSVYRGLEAYMLYGEDIYYNPDDLKANTPVKYTMNSQYFR
jgi:hypothetical protein